MNGRKSKELRMKAGKLLLSLGVSLSEGHREYKQEENCKDWGPVILPDGTRLKGPDGTPMMKPIRTPGTLHSQWKWRVFYRFLKKLHKRGDKYAQKILSMSNKELLDYFGRT